MKERKGQGDAPGALRARPARTLDLGLREKVRPQAEPSPNARPRYSCGTSSPCAILQTTFSKITAPWTSPATIIITGLANPVHSSDLLRLHAPSTATRTGWRRVGGAADESHMTSAKIPEIRTFGTWTTNRKKSLSDFPNRGTSPVLGPWSRHRVQIRCTYLVMVWTTMKHP